MLTYRKSDHLEVIGYTYSNFVSCMDTRKSTFGYVYLLARGAISWKSAKQSVIVASTMEVEFMACFNEGMTTSLEAPLRRITRSMSRGESSIPSPLSLFCITLV